MTSPNLYGGGRCGSGWMRPDKSTGKIAVPEGPQQPIERERVETVSDNDPRLRGATTAENLAARAAAVGVRRFSWEGGQ